MKKPIVLCVMDGCAINKDSYGNAFLNATKPNINSLFEKYSVSCLEASGSSVGLPDGQMGNSEVGHMNIGAGRIVYQPLELINRAITSKTFLENNKVIDIFKHVTENNSNLHIMGLVSDGGIHSHINHLMTLLDMCKIHNINNVYLHLFTDGRDTYIKSGRNYVQQVTDKLKKLEIGTIATISGRYYAMDRDNNLDRLNLAYQAIVNGTGIKYNSIEEVFDINYNNGITDEFIVPSIINLVPIEDNDAIITFNYRPDRLREITIAITNPSCINNEYKKFNNIKFLSMMPIHLDAIYDYIFDYDNPNNTLGPYLDKLGYKQLRIAETEKYAHVTYFFDGGKEIELDNSKRILIPSPKIKTYDLKPEMSAYLITEKLIEEIDKDYFDFVLMNYANGDMVGHTGNYEATVKAIEVLDKCVGMIYEKIKEKDGLLILTADHGNSDVMYLEDGSPCTTHTLNKVPFLITSEKINLRKGGILADIAPTILDILKIDKPIEMTGISLIDLQFTNDKKYDNINIERIDNMNENNEPIVIDDAISNEEVNNAPKEIKKEEVIKEPKKKKKKGIFSTILNILVTLLFIFVIIETYIGFTGFNAIKENKEPKYLINKFDSTKDGVKETTYNFGLYKCVKTEDSKKYSYKLLPFFID